MIIGFLGNLGRGKTLGATFLTKHFLENTRIDNVVTNYETDFTTHKVDNVKELDEISQRKGFSAIYTLDEVWAWMMARQAQQNFDMVDFVLNSRKRGCLIIHTTQKKRQIDPILEENTDVWVVPIHKEALETGKPYDTLELYMIDSESEEIINRFLINAEMFYNTYDTEEEVSSQTEADKYADLMDEYEQRVRNKEFEYKKELSSYLHMNEGISINGSERLTDEIFRRVRNSDKTSKQESIADAFENKTER